MGVWVPGGDGAGLRGRKIQSLLEASMLRMVMMMMVSLTKFHIPHPIIGVRVVARVWLARVWLAWVWCWLFEIHLKGVAAIEVGAGDALES